MGIIIINHFMRQIVILFCEKLLLYKVNFVYFPLKIIYFLKFTYFKTGIKTFPSFYWVPQSKFEANRSRVPEFWLEKQAKREYDFVCKMNIE